MLARPAVIGMVAFLHVFAGILVLGTLLVSRARRRERQTRSRLHGLATSPAPVPEGVTSGSSFLRGLLQLVALVGSGTDTRVPALRTRCLQAGIFHANAPMIFLGAKLLLTVLLMLAGVLVAFWVSPALWSSGPSPRSLPPWLTLAGCTLAGAAAGMLVPSYWLSARVRGRERLLRHALPDALDMLVLCLEGGLTFAAALQRVTDELHVVHPELGVELMIVQREMELGLSGGDALRKFADRCGLADVRDLASVIQQSERFGASVTRALRTYADGARLERQQKAEEEAQKAAVKILFPTLLCIFPAIFIVVLGPAAFQMAQLFSR